jgi:hypothetical protein
MNSAHPSPQPENGRPGFDSSDALLVVVEGGGDTTVRPITPEEIAAVKRFWARHGRTPPPPYDKL